MKKQPGKKAIHLISFIVTSFSTVCSGHRSVHHPQGFPSQLLCNWEGRWGSRAKNLPLNLNLIVLSHITFLLSREDKRPLTSSQVYFSFIPSLLPSLLSSLSRYSYNFWLLYRKSFASLSVQAFKNHAVMKIPTALISWPYFVLEVGFLGVGLDSGDQGLPHCC